VDVHVVGCGRSASSMSGRSDVFVKIMGKDVITNLNVHESELV